MRTRIFARMKDSMIKVKVCIRLHYTVTETRSSNIEVPCAVTH